MNKRTKALIAGGAAAAIIGVAGFAFADFVRSESATATNSAEQFNTLSVTADADDQALIPGEHSTVTLALTNPNAAKAKVVGIAPDPTTPVTVDPASLADPGDAEYCEDLIHLSPSGPGNAALPTLNGNGNASHVLNQAVTLDPAMDISCEGMSFTTKWVVQFQAVRS